MRAVVEPGARWIELDQEAQRYGLATPGGRVSTTGVAGFTLGGGAGWLMGRCGLACDNLVSAEVVTAAGEVVKASEQENPDLLWALRGGGGNFGVVSSFEFALHPINVTLSGLLAWPRTKALEVMRFFGDLALRAPDDLGLVFACVTGRDGRAGGHGHHMLDRRGRGREEVARAPSSVRITEHRHDRRDEVRSRSSKCSITPAYGVPVTIGNPASFPS